MAHIKLDRVFGTTTSTGTGALTLDSAAVPGYSRFQDVMADNDTAFVMIVDRTTQIQEGALVTYSAGALTRADPPLSSSTGSKINFPAGIKDIFIYAPAAKALVENPDGSVSVTGDFSARNMSSAAIAAGISLSSVGISGGSVILSGTTWKVAWAGANGIISGAPVLIDALASTSVIDGKVLYIDLVNDTSTYQVVLATITSDLRADFAGGKKLMLLYNQGGTCSGALAAALHTNNQDRVALKTVAELGVIADGTTDNTATMTTALAKAAEGPYIIQLPPGRVGLNPINLTGLTEQDTVIIRGGGQGSELYWLTAAQNGKMIRISGTLIVGDLLTAFPLSSSTTGWVLNSDHPSATVASDIPAGVWEVPVTDIRDFQDGYGVRIRAHRLTPKCETRNYKQNGEINKIRRIVAGTGNTGTLVLELKTKHGYHALGSVFDGGITAGSDFSVTLDPATAALPTSEDNIVGCRITVDGHVRYIRYYNPATGIVYMDGNSADPILPFDPIPTTLSHVVIDRPAYVSAIRMPKVDIQNVSFGANALINVDRLAVQIDYADCPNLSSLSLNKTFPREGIHLTYCYRPTLVNIDAIDNNYSGIGHALTIEGSRDVVVDGLRTLNSGSPCDISGEISCTGVMRNSVIDGGQMSFNVSIGQDAAPYSVASPNAGLSSHGAAFDFLYENNIVRNVINPILVRGYGERFINNRIEGPFYRLARCTEGGDVVIDGVYIDQQTDVTVDPPQQGAISLAPISLAAQSYAAGSVTFLTSAAHGKFINQGFIIQNSGNYNGSYIATTGTTGSTLVAARADDPGTSVTLGSMISGGGALLEVDSRNWRGDITFRNVRASRGVAMATDSPIMLFPAVGRPWLSSTDRRNRYDPGSILTVENIDVKIISAFDKTLFDTDSGSALASIGWRTRIGANDIRVVGGGKWKGLAAPGNISWAMNNAPANVIDYWNWTGPDTVLAAINDDSVIVIPWPTTFDYVEYKITEMTTNGGALFQKRWDVVAAAHVGEMGGSTSIALPTTVPLTTGTSDGTDTKLNVAHDKVFVYVKNRTGSSGTFLIQRVGGTV